MTSPVEVEEFSYQPAANGAGEILGDGVVLATIRPIRLDAPPREPATTVPRINGEPATTDTGMHLDGDNWPDPILPGHVPVPDLPTDLLPTWVKDMAGAVAESTQTPPALAVMLSLSVLATCLHRRFEVAPYGVEDDYSEPLAIWTLTALPSGSRKTAVINALAAPLIHWEKLERDRLRPEIARISTARAVAKKRIEKLTKDAVNADNDEAREEFRKAIQSEEETMPLEIRAPRLWCADTTPERLQNMLAEHAESMSVMSDEAGIFQIMAGLYSGGVANNDVFLQGHSGSPMRVDRADRAAHIDRPALSFGLALQPDVLAEVASVRRFRASGLLARFLYAMPNSNVGKRDVRRRWSIPVTIANEYERRLHELLAGRQLFASKPRIIGMSDAARDAWLDFSEEIEQQQGERGAMESIIDWSSKLPGAAARIAALLELAEHGVDAAEVSQASTARAVALCRLLIPHAHAAFGLLGADATDADAAAIVKWVRDNRFLSFNKSSCQKAMEGRFRTVARLDKAIERLEHGDVAKVEKVPNHKARPTTMIRMNPKLFID